MIELEGKKSDDGKLPIATMMLEQFPLAIQAVAGRSLFGHIKYAHNDQDWTNWKNVPDATRRYKDAILRHMMELGEEGETSSEHAAAVAWNALAVLQMKLENENEESKS